MKRPLFALLGVLVLVGAAVGPAVAASTQAGNDGTSAGNAPAEDSFGQQVSSFVHQLQNTTNGTGIGPAVSTFVTANNPGNAPPWAGSPGGPNANDTNATVDTNGSVGGPPAFVLAMFGGANATDGNETDRRGPPAHAGPGQSGPPAHAGPDGPNDDNDTEATEDADENETEADADERDGDDGERGPPEHAGPPDTSDGADSASDDDAEDEEAEADDDNDGERGPPDDAGPPGDRGR